MKHGIMIKTSGHCLYKSVIVAQTDGPAQQELARLQAKYPGLTVTLHDYDDAEFQNTVIDQPGLIEVN